MKTIDGNSTHRHRWRSIGAHTLHAGHENDRLYYREIRHVSVCMIAGCKEVRVSIQKHVAYCWGDEHTFAMTQQTDRIPGKTAKSLARRNPAFTGLTKETQ